MRNFFGFYAILQGESKAKSAAMMPFGQSAPARPTLKDRSLDDKSELSDG
jgi:hypothetical protein